jgi:hypothetical protein
MILFVKYILDSEWDEEYIGFTLMFVFSVYVHDLDHKNYSQSYSISDRKCCLIGTLKGLFFEFHNHFLNIYEQLTKIYKKKNSNDIMVFGKIKF